MATPSVVAVLLLGTGLGSPGVEELRSSAQQALGPDTEVRVAIVTETSDPSAPRGAAGVVRLSFGPDAQHVRLGCYLPRLRRWVERDLWFDADDPETERGRTLGFLVASMVVDQGALPRPALTPIPEPRRHAAGDQSAKAPGTSVAVGVEAAGPGTGSGFGAYAGLERMALPWLGIGGAAHARFGSIQEAQASTRLLALGPELSLRPIQIRRAWLGVRANLTLSYLWVSHLSEDDERPDSQVRWLPGAELAAHCGFQVAPAVAIFADAGATGLLGETEFEVRHRVVAVWPWLSGLVRLGIQADL
jgi:hypothetical protein